VTYWQAVGPEALMLILAPPLAVLEVSAAIRALVSRAQVNRTRPGQASPTCKADSVKTGRLI
jgi:hypothetical protein